MLDGTISGAAAPFVLVDDSLKNRGLRRLRIAHLVGWRSLTPESIGHYPVRFKRTRLLSFDHP